MSGSIILVILGSAVASVVVQLWLRDKWEGSGYPTLPSPRHCAAVAVLLAVMLLLTGCSSGPDVVWELELADGSKVYAASRADLVLSQDGRVLLNIEAVTFNGVVGAKSLRLAPKKP